MDLDAHPIRKLRRFLAPRGRRSPQREDNDQEQAAAEPHERPHLVAIRGHDDHRRALTRRQRLSIVTEEGESDTGRGEDPVFGVTPVRERKNLFARCYRWLRERLRDPGGDGGTSQW